MKLALGWSRSGRLDYSAAAFIFVRQPSRDTG